MSRVGGGAGEAALLTQPCMTEQQSFLRCARVICHGCLTFTCSCKIGTTYIPGICSSSRKVATLQLQEETALVEMSLLIDEISAFSFLDLTCSYGRASVRLSLQTGPDVCVSSFCWGVLLRHAGWVEVQSQVTRHQRPFLAAPATSPIRLLLAKWNSSSTCVSPLWGVIAGEYMVQGIGGISRKVAIYHA